MDKIESIKQTETKEELLNKLAVSTRSPRGRFSAAAGYPLFQRRLQAYTRRRFLWRAGSAAAAAVLFCLTLWHVYGYYLTETLQTVSTLADTRTISLPDGSSVTLNHYSTLTYPKRFKPDSRVVELVGEAYFEVSKDTLHPFIVQTSAVDIQVLGTRFDVEAYPANPDVRTTLLTGAVAVCDKSQSTRLVLKPNETAVYDKEQGEFTRHIPENAQDEIGWRQGNFIFDNLPLEDIVREIANASGTTIHIADSALRQYRITAKFCHEEDPLTVLNVLHHAGYFNYSQTGNRITITTQPSNYYE